MNNRWKFRGKDISTGEWRYGNLIIEEAPLQCLTNEKGKDKYYIGKSGFADWNMPRPYEMHEVDSTTVGQYTGLQDSQGKEVYEGDFIKGDGYGPYPVEYYKGYWSSMCYSDDDNIYMYKKIEVTGNIHDKQPI